ncbi:TetR family transcriptional regulator [Sinorhizobium medicae]|nr:TetR family transcriptional regulator [Sinorhizobium medicae]MDX1162467.1 TetR family transcriptional regulator [Sinorhizobium medicae]
MEISEYKIDRRVARTRKSLHQALISLILEKGYDSITVDEICQTANVGRSTFYLHFTSKDDLKRAASTTCEGSSPRRPPARLKATSETGDWGSASPCSNMPATISISIGRWRAAAAERSPLAPSARYYPTCCAMNWPRTQIRLLETTFPENSWFSTSWVPTWPC